MILNTDFLSVLTFGIYFLTAWWLISILPPKLSRIFMPVLLLTVLFFAYQYVLWTLWWDAIRTLFSR